MARSCEIEGCGKPLVARGWCTAHWTRWKRHGAPTARLRGEVVDGKRICPRCEVDKPLDQWGQGACRPCINARAVDRRKANPAPRKAHTPFDCAHCGMRFMGNKKQVKYCSRTCADADRNRANWKYLTARRARLRDAFVESFDRLEIFERDEWMCGICGCAIDPSVEWPDPQSASLDHILPIARGGTHSRANAQASHLTCNVRKGVAVTEEVSA